MSQLIQLKPAENSDDVKEAMAILTSEIEQYTSTLGSAKKKLQEHNLRDIAIAIELPGCFDNVQLKKLKQEHKSIKAAIKQQENMIRVASVSLGAAQVDLGQLSSAAGNDWKSKATHSNVIAAFESLNGNFIASESQWYCIYDNDNRVSPLVVKLSNEGMKDMILCESGWVESQDATIKQIARDCGRMYKNVERTFNKAKPGVLNQMDELRKFWLEPIFDKAPHIAFTTLIDNIADGAPEYVDFIERYIAYTYIKPQDIFSPSIDSIAKGGSGRDTFFRILEIIFTEECCGEATFETFSGTHNGELWGKVLVKISEQDSNKIEYSQFKNLTGGHNFRLRRMGENAVQTARTFRFFIMGNKYNGTIPLTGKGRGSQDRRVEPIISLTSLTTKIGQVYEWDENTVDGSENIYDVLQDWQDNVFQNEEQIAILLGWLIQRHKPETMKKLVPIHGKYYDTMKDRQKNSFNRFMEIVASLTADSNCYDVGVMHRIYEISNCVKITKNQFGKRMSEWLIENSGAEWEIKLKNVFVDGEPTKRSKRTVVHIKPGLGRPAVVQGQEDDTEYEHDDGLRFSVWDFIEQDGVDEKDKKLGNRPHANNIREELV